MIKIFITAIESNDNGTAVTLFEDYQLRYTDSEHLETNTEVLGQLISDKVVEVEKMNLEQSNPL